MPNPNAGRDKLKRHPVTKVKPARDTHVTNKTLSNISKSQNSSNLEKSIPCPKGRIGRNGLKLQEALGLSDNQARYDRIQNISRHIISRKMDFRRTFRGHTEEEIALTLRALSAEIPFLSRFERHWASRAIVKAILANNSPRLRKLYKMERAAERMDAKGIEEVDRNEAGGNISMESYLSEDEKSRKQGQAEAGEDSESESDDEIHEEPQTKKTSAALKPSRAIPEARIANRTNDAVLKPRTSTYGTSRTLGRTRDDTAHIENKDRKTNNRSLKIKTSTRIELTPAKPARTAQNTLKSPNDLESDIDHLDGNTETVQDDEDGSAGKEKENAKQFEANRNVQEPRLITEFFHAIAKKPLVATSKNELNVTKPVTEHAPSFGARPLLTQRHASKVLPRSTLEPPVPRSVPKPALNRPIRSNENTILYNGEEDSESDTKDSSFDPESESVYSDFSSVQNELSPHHQVSPTDNFEGLNFDFKKYDVSDTSDPADNGLRCPVCDAPVPDNASPEVLDLLNKRKKLEGKKATAAIAKLDFQLCPLIERSRDTDDIVNNAMGEDWYDAALAIKWNQLPGRVFKFGKELKSLIASHNSLRNFWVFRKLEKIYSPDVSQLANSAILFSDFCASNTKAGYYGQLGHDIIVDCLTTMFPPHNMDLNVIKPFTGHQIILLVLLPATVIKLMMHDLYNQGYDEEGLRVLLQSSARWGELVQITTIEEEADPNSEVNQIRRDLRKRLHSLLDNKENILSHAPPPRVKRKAQINTDTKSLQKFIPDIPKLSKAFLTIDDFQGKLPAGVALSKTKRPKVTKDLQGKAAATPSPRKNKRKAAEDLENIMGNELEPPSPVKATKAPAGQRGKKPRLTDKTDNTSMNPPAANLSRSTMRNGVGRPIRKVGPPLRFRPS
ncbi:hypothetical protein D9757_007789 [Collybiopsis confluens]|uniref:Restriction of telomere capping protein 4 C-terminal domain-containing protein n=1 Tax=Collybiopsis confluens TaxID=2823264 RepID=A0A8H5HQM7_9AGAR|nr:hypothetical protein D9757_007789 [Collybiopsis confluens]